MSCYKFIVTIFATATSTAPCRRPPSPHRHRLIRNRRHPGRPLSLPIHTHTHTGVFDRAVPSTRFSLVHCFSVSHSLCTYILYVLPSPPHPMSLSGGPGRQLSALYNIHPVPHRCHIETGPTPLPQTSSVISHRIPICVVYRHRTNSTDSLPPCPSSPRISQLHTHTYYT